MVRELFEVEPDPWQDEVCARSRTLLASPRRRRRVLASRRRSHGWDGIPSHARHPNIAVTSVCGDNLRNGLWKEFAVWQNKSPLLQKAFQWTASKIFLKQHPGTWFAHARTWPKSRQQRTDRRDARRAACAVPAIPDRRIRFDPAGNHAERRSRVLIRAHEGMPYRSSRKHELARWRAVPCVCPS